MKKLNIFIDGMHCESCASALREALEAVAGVQTCDVRVGEAEVTFDPSVTTKAEVFDAIRAGGRFEIRSFSAH